MGVQQSWQCKYSPMMHEGRKGEREREGECLCVYSSSREGERKKDRQRKGAGTYGGPVRVI